MPADKRLALLSIVSMLAVMGAAPAQAEDAAHFQTPTPNTAEATNNWTYKLGGGVGYAPEYEGSDNYTLVPVPIVEAEYKEGLFFGNLQQGIGSYPVQGDGYKLGGSIGYAFGRDEDDDDDNLEGMGDVDGSATANLMGEYQVGPGAFMGRLSTALSGDYGTTADVKYGTRLPVTDNTTLMGSIGTTWADEEHMDNYFGVSPGQAARSGYTIYDTDAGFKSIGATVGANYAITPAWNATVTVKADQMIGDAADSPITKNDFNPSAFVTTSYGF